MGRRLPHRRRGGGHLVARRTRGQGQGEGEGRMPRSIRPGRLAPSLAGRLLGRRPPVPPGEWAGAYLIGGAGEGIWWPGEQEDRVRGRGKGGCPGPSDPAGWRPPWPGGSWAAVPRSLRVNGPAPTSSEARGRAFGGPENKRTGSGGGGREDAPVHPTRQVGALLGRAAPGPP